MASSPNDRQYTWTLSLETGSYELGARCSMAAKSPRDTVKPGMEVGRVFQWHAYTWILSPVIEVDRVFQFFQWHALYLGSITSDKKWKPGHTDQQDHKRLSVDNGRKGRPSKPILRSTGSNIRGRCSLRPLSSPISVYQHP